MVGTHAPRLRESVSRLWRLTCIVLAASSLAACDASYPASPSPTIVALEVQHAQPTGLLLVGESRSFRAYLVDSDGAYEDVTHLATWSPSVNSASGVFGANVTAASPGTTEVRATHAGFTDALTLFVQTVHPPYPYVSILPRSLRAPYCEGTMELLEHDEQFPEGRRVMTGITWSSSNPEVATVDGNGAVTTHSPGTTEFRASYQNRSTWIRCSVAPRQW